MQIFFSPGTTTTTETAPTTTTEPTTTPTPTTGEEHLLQNLHILIPTE